MCFLVGKINKKTIISILSIIVLVVVVNVGYDKYQEYARKKELEDEIEFIQGEIDKLNAGETSEYAENLRNVQTSSALSSLSLSNFSARSDGTFVNAYGSITNLSNNYIDEILNIAFLDENGGVIKVKHLIIELGSGETMHFEELIGLAKDNTQIPASAELTN